MQTRSFDFVTGAPEKYAYLVDALSTLGERTASTLAGRNAADVRHAPSGGWSAQQVLAHMAFLGRENRIFIRQVATMTEPERRAFPSGYDDTELAQRPTAELLSMLGADLAQIVELLSHTPDAAWGRPGYVRGARISLRQLVASHIAHFEEHLGQIAQVLAAAAAER